MSNVEDIKRILGVCNVYEWCAPDKSIHVKWENGTWYFWGSEWIEYSVDANRILNYWFKRHPPTTQWKECMKTLYDQGLRL